MMAVCLADPDHPASYDPILGQAFADFFKTDQQGKDKTIMQFCDYLQVMDCMSNIELILMPYWCCSFVPRPLVKIKKTFCFFFAFDERPGYTRLLVLVPEVKLF